MQPLASVIFTMTFKEESVTLFNLQMWRRRKALLDKRLRAAEPGEATGTLLQVSALSILPCSFSPSRPSCSKAPLARSGHSSPKLQGTSCAGAGVPPPPLQDPCPGPAPALSLPLSPPAPAALAPGSPSQFGQTFRERGSRSSKASPRKQPCSHSTVQPVGPENHRSLLRTQVAFKTRRSGDHVTWLLQEEQGWPSHQLQERLTWLLATP